MNTIRLFFKFKDYKTTFKKEIIGGIVTALSMIYILSVEPSILSGSKSIDPNYKIGYGGIFLATVIITFLGTLIMGLNSNMPVAMAPSMGLNAVFTFNVANSSIGNNHLGYQGALIAVMISSILFTIITVTNIRTYILKCISYNMRIIIGVGIGFFIAYIGLKGINLFELKDGLPIAQLSSLKQNYPEILIGLFVLILIFIFHFKKIPGGIFISILIGLVLSLILGNTVHLLSSKSHREYWSIWNGWKYNQLGSFSTNIKSVFTNFTNKNIWSSPTFYIGIFVFIFVSFFDASGTLYSIANQISHQSVIKYKVSKKALISDAFGGILNGFLGVSPSTTFVESTSGVAQGARTGFSSIVVATIFLLAIPLFPLFQLIKLPIVSPALIFVGIMMVSQINKIDWKLPEYYITAFLMILLMVTTYSITNGIAFGFIFYTIILLIEKKFDKLTKLHLILDLFFIGYFIAFAFLQ